MILTMEALTPLYGEAVARVLVEAADCEARFPSGEQLDAPRLMGAVRALHAVADVLTREPPEVAHMRRISSYLDGLGIAETLPRHAVSDRVRVLGRAYSDAKRAVETAKGCTDAVAVTLRYQVAQANKRTAHERYNAAGPAIDLASIRERLAEIECQHDPIHNLVNSAMAPMYDGDGVPDHVYHVVRELCCTVAGYVVVGHIKYGTPLFPRG